MLPWLGVGALIGDVGPWVAVLFYKFNLNICKAKHML